MIFAASGRAAVLALVRRPDELFARYEAARSALRISDAYSVSSSHESTTPVLSAR